MKSLIYGSLAVISLSLSGCASLFPPKAEDLANVPVVRFGEAAPAGGEFVMYYPKGAPLPVRASVDGNLLGAKAEASMQAAVNRDIYQYKQWLSFDGKTWVYGRDAVSGEFRIDLPGLKDGRNPGTLSAEFNLK